MKLDNFILWKFKELEGKLKYFHASDVCTSRIEKGFSTYKLSYNLETNTATLKDGLSGAEIFSCKFKELVDKLKEHNLYEERTDNRSENSRIPFVGNLDEI